MKRACPDRMQADRMQAVVPPAFLFYTVVGSQESGFRRPLPAGAVGAGPRRLAPSWPLQNALPAATWEPFSVPRSSCTPASTHVRARADTHTHARTHTCIHGAKKLHNDKDAYLLLMPRPLFGKLHFRRLQLVPLFIGACNTCSFRCFHHARPESASSSRRVFTCIIHIDFDKYCHVTSIVVCLSTTTNNTAAAAATTTANLNPEPLNRYDSTTQHRLQDALALSHPRPTN